MTDRFTKRKKPEENDEKYCQFYETIMCFMATKMKVLYWKVTKGVDVLLFNGC